MRLLIVEDAPWIAALIKQVVQHKQPQARIDVSGSLAQALDAIRHASYDAILVDWNLPDGTGLAFVHELRQNDRKTPVLMVTGRHDRDSVIAARSLGISAFITKPFQVPRLIAALEQALPGTAFSHAPQAPTDDLLGYLAGLRAEQLELPLLDSVRKTLLRHIRGDSQPLEAMFSQWMHDPALSAHLIAAANHSGDYSEPVCLDVSSAIQRLGVATSLEIACAIAQVQDEIGAPLLSERVADQLHIGETLALRVAELALSCGLDSPPLQSAARLHRMGELCVLAAARRWSDQGANVDAEQLNKALAEFSQPFAITLKAHLGLPMTLRDLIGAVYSLPQRQVSRAQALMRLASAELGQEPAAVCERLRHMVGMKI